jgi:predicted nuclease with TOPRIM domain
VREQLEARLKGLEEEFEKGRTMLQEAERQRADLEAMMLRIDGAITALREALQEADASNGKPEALAAAEPAAEGG